MQVNVIYSPFPFKRGLWYIGYRNHLFSWSNPHNGTVVALGWTHQTQTGERSPWKCPLQPDRLGKWEKEDMLQNQQNQSFMSVHPSHFLSIRISHITIKKYHKQKLHHWQNWTLKMFQSKPSQSQIPRQIGSCQATPLLHNAGDSKCQHRTANRKACHSCFSGTWANSIFEICSCTGIKKIEQTTWSDTGSCVKSLWHTT